jgi:hypothetical protein
MRPLMWQYLTGRRDMSETDITIVNARAHPALKLLGVESLYGNSTATYDLRTGVQADASTLFTQKNYSLEP